MKSIAPLALVLCLAGCTSPVDILSIAPSDDFRSLGDDERGEFEWAAIAINISADTARRLHNAESSNVNLRLFRCGDPEDYYPAFASYSGAIYHYRDLPVAAPGPVALIFHLPKHVQQRNLYGCARLDARGYWPHFYASQTVRLPSLTFRRVPRASTPASVR